MPDAQSRPDEWRDELIGQLDHRWRRLRAFDAYYDGDQVLAFVTRKYRDAYGGFFKGLTDNWMPIVVDAPVERLRVQGFRFGSDQEADKDAWSIWQDNGLDGESSMLHTEAVKLGMGYWMVNPVAGDGSPRITAEHPSQVIVATEPGDRRKRIAAVKKWADGEFIYANVFQADRVTKYRTTKRQLQIETGDKRWETIGATGNPLKAIPLIPMPNNPSMLKGGRSDLAGGAIPIQDAVNLLLSSTLIGAEYQAYPLRVLLGVDQPRKPDGTPVENAELELSQSRLLMFPGDAKEMDVKEFSAADLENLRKQIDGLIRDLTAQTRTPPHYVSGAIVNASGDALKAAETGLVSKTRKKMDPFGEAHEETIRLAFLAKDSSDERAQAMDAETIWRNPESRSEAELVDAATKKQSLGVPQEVLWEDIGYSPQQIDRMRALQERDRLLAASRAEAAPPQPPGADQPQPAPGQNGTAPQKAEPIAGAGVGT